MCVAYVGPAGIENGGPVHANAVADWEKSAAVAPLVAAEIVLVFTGMGATADDVAEVLPAIVPDGLMDRATALIALVPGDHR